MLHVLSRHQRSDPMRMFLSLVLATTLVSGIAHASGGSKPEPPPSNPSSSTGDTNDAQPAVESSARADAERTYALAYDEVAKAKDEVEKGKAKNAQKKFKKALEHAQRATDLDQSYHEAWNLIGYCERKLGDYEKAFAAYDKCLSIKSDYAPAREYLGEAWLEKGDDKKAHEQLAMLEKAGAQDEMARLTAAIQTYEKAHPEAAAPADMTEAPAAASTPADSTSGNH
ncbi:MAG: tetratricopeptide repeat protein [Candidatus Eisenbacteria bacterium]|uniref:Tetratricopeptide repeat protein n=1 Tax=Eiseniibacteriota bacterium TaxID=2212470 RepID=A0A538TV19_UNCEI|nr:MAG: tetratricopeptide repeat protein [Candidatus Eisenbacteria bacterium]